MALSPPERRAQVRCSRTSRCDFMRRIRAGLHGSPALRWCPRGVQHGAWILTASVGQHGGTLGGGARAVITGAYAVAVRDV